MPFPFNLRANMRKLSLKRQTKKTSGEKFISINEITEIRFERTDLKTSSRENCANADYLRHCVTGAPHDELFQ